jgi:hypothetical protein
MAAIRQRWAGIASDTGGDIMKVVLILIMLCVPILAQEKPSVYLIDKSRGLQIYAGDELKPSDLVLFTEGTNTTGKVALVLKSRDREAILDSIEMTGIVGGRRVVPETCFGSKGQDCIVHGKIFR